MCLKEPASVRLECKPARDTLDYLSDNDKLFVSNLDYKKAAPNVILDRINCSLLILLDVKEINDSTSTLDQVY